MKNCLNKSRLKREIGLFSSTSLVIANMVGTGIFTTSGFILKELGNPWTMLACWFVGGLFALSGALCYGELGSRFPKAGGEYIYLKKSFGRCLGFLSGWISLIVGFSAPIAAAAIAFSSYLFQAFGIEGGDSGGLALVKTDLLNLSAHSFLAVCVVLGFSFLHYHSLKIGSRVQNLLTLFKISIILFFIAAGLFSGQGSISHFQPGFEIKQLLHGNFAVALIFVSFAYSGWNAAAYLGAEIKSPKKNIPRALFGGTLLVMSLYLLLNIVFIYALPKEKMSGILDVGTQAAIALFGINIGHYISGLIAIGLLSVISAMIMAGPRVYYAMSKDGLFFKRFARVSGTRSTPAQAIFLQAAIAIAMILTSSFDMLLIYIGFTLSMIAMLTVIGLMLIRRKQPKENSYTTLGYPVTPLVFIMGNAWILYFSVKSRPLPSLLGLLTICSGLFIYRYFNEKEKTVTIPSTAKATIKRSE